MPLSKTLGAQASATWLEHRGLDASKSPHWYVEMTIAADTADAQFELNIYPEEWGFIFRRGARVSSIRVTDVAFVHGVDEFHLLRETPDLMNLPELLAKIEQRHGLQLQVERVEVRSNLARASEAARRWLARPS